MSFDAAANWAALSVLVGICAGIGACLVITSTWPGVAEWWLRRCRDCALDDIDGDPGYCQHCGAPWQWVRPGKAQPTCECEAGYDQ